MSAEHSDSYEQQATPYDRIEMQVGLFTAAFSGLHEQGQQPEDIMSRMEDRMGPTWIPKADGSTVEMGLLEIGPDNGVVLVGGEDNNTDYTVIRFSAKGMETGIPVVSEMSRGERHDVEHSAMTLEDFTGSPAEADAVAAQLAHNLDMLYHGEVVPLDQQ